MRKSKRKSENTLRQMKTKTIQSLCDVAKTVLREFIETHAYLKKQKSQINNLKEKEQSPMSVKEGNNKDQEGNKQKPKKIEKNKKKPRAVPWKDKQNL